MRKEIVVAVVDTGIDHSRMTAQQRGWLYRNDAEIAGNGRDDDGNGLVDDVTGPSGGGASNGGYQAVEESMHGHGMAQNVMRQLQAAEDALGAPLAASVMPVSMYEGGYYGQIVAAAKAGASVISLSHNLSHGQKVYISEILEPYDAIAVTLDRDLPGDANPDAGEGAGRAFDNVIEVAMISEAVTRGNVHVDLLELGSSVDNQSESHAIANAAGKIAAIWAVDPARDPAAVLDIVAASTDRDHATIQSKGLRAEMGGQIDLARAVALAGGPAEAKPEPAPRPEPEREIENVKAVQKTHDLNPITAEGGYQRGTAGDDLIMAGDTRAIIYNGGGDDVFVFAERPGREHVVCGFDEGDLLDVSTLVADQGAVRLREVSWGGDTHTRVLVQDEAGTWDRVVLLEGVDDLDRDVFVF